MDNNDDKGARPSTLPVDRDTLGFLALLCDEIGDKEAVIRAYERWTKGERIEHAYAAPRPREYEGRAFASEMGRRAAEIEREKEATFDPARQIKVVDEQGHVRILNKSWASEVAKKAREEEEKRPWLKESNC